MRTVWSRLPESRSARASIAAELFARAADLTPKEPSAHWLLAQADFALGKYREAVEAIAAGMALRADWSEARFNARDLYWKRPELFDDHLKALRDAVAMFPDDASLLFLLGHQLWFDGKHDEAAALILKARQLGKGSTPAEQFAVR
jgi:tetratricopeptide (TPR) repeat protein